MPLRDPPDPTKLDPLLHSWPAGVPILRVHSLDRRGHTFNPGHGPRGRFHPIKKGDASVVPWLYGAEDEEATLCETVFHDLAFAPGERISEAVLHGQALSSVIPGRELSLALLAGLGLRRLGVARAEIVEGGPTTYEATARWAQALHDCPAHPDGIMWMARPHDMRRSLVLFGDRVSQADLDLRDGPLPLAFGPGRAKVLKTSIAAKIVLVPIE